MASRLQLGLKGGQQLGGVPPPAGAAHQDQNMHMKTLLNLGFPNTYPRLGAGSAWGTGESAGEQGQAGKQLVQLVCGKGQVLGDGKAHHVRTAGDGGQHLGQGLH